MTSTLKHSALAILVSFGLSGCFLTGSSDTENKADTKPINPQPVVAPKTDKNGEEWRHIRLATGDSEIPQGKSGNTTYLLFSDTFGPSMRWDGADDDSDRYYLDFSEFAQGKTEGSVSKKINLVVDDKIYPNPDNAETKFNYLVINQPYSTYGVLFVENKPEFGMKTFYVGQNATAEGFRDNDAEYSVGKYNPKTQETTWNKGVEGSATYKGDVISISPKNGDKPIVDGTITLKANFVNGVDKSTVSASLDTKTTGKVDFPEGTIYPHGNFHTMDRLIKGKFVGKDFNDVVGAIRGTPNDRTYFAMFGATKQK